MAVGPAARLGEDPHASEEIGRMPAGHDRGGGGAHHGGRNAKGAREAAGERTGGRVRSGRPKVRGRMPTLWQR